MKKSRRKEKISILIKTRGKVLFLIAN